MSYEESALEAIVEAKRYRGDGNLSASGYESVRWTEAGVYALLEIAAAVRELTRTLYNRNP